MTICAAPLPALDIEPRKEDAESPDFEPVFQRINALLIEEESWREPRLSLAEIASKLRISQRDASRAINLHSGQSFSRYINRFPCRRGRSPDGRSG